MAEELTHRGGRVTELSKGLELVLTGMSVTTRSWKGKGVSYTLSREHGPGDNPGCRLWLPQL